MVDPSRSSLEGCASAGRTKRTAGVSRSLFSIACLLFVLLMAESVSAIPLVPAQLSAMLDIAAVVPSLQNGSDAWTVGTLMETCTLAPTIRARGVICDALAGVITRINLRTPEEEVTGPLPDSIGSLTSLTQLRMDHVQWNGTLPAVLSTLSNLQRIVLPEARFSGDAVPLMPPSLLTFHVGFDGEVTTWNPAPLFAASNLEDLGLFNYNFGPNSPIPENIFTTWGLRFLRLNRITFNGDVPPGLLTNPALSEIIISGSAGMELLPPSLTPIPDDWTYTADLSILNFDRLPWSGSIPTRLPQSRLNEIAFTRLPYLSGTIPLSIFTSSDIISVRLESLPLVTGNLTAPNAALSPMFEELIVSDVGLTGSFDPLFLIAPGMRRFNLSYVPSMAQQTLQWLAGSCNLEEFVAVNTSFVGAIPAGLAGCPGLHTVHLENNAFTGPIPQAILQKSFLNIFLQGNELDICATDIPLNAAECSVYPQAQNFVCSCVDVWLSSSCPLGCNATVEPISVPVDAPSSPLEPLTPSIPSGPVSSPSSSPLSMPSAVPVETPAAEPTEPTSPVSPTTPTTAPAEPEPTPTGSASSLVSSASLLALTVVSFVAASL